MRLLSRCMNNLNTDDVAQVWSRCFERRWPVCRALGEGLRSCWHGQDETRVKAGHLSTYNNHIAAHLEPSALSWISAGFFSLSSMSNSFNVSWLCSSSLVVGLPANLNLDFCCWYCIRYLYLEVFFQRYHQLLSLAQQFVTVCWLNVHMLCTCWHSLCLFQ